MAIGYTDVPGNMPDLMPYIITDKGKIVSEIIGSQKCYFYDTCSLRKHANLSADDAKYLLKYIKAQQGIVVITRCILMELASIRGVLAQNYIAYIRQIQAEGIPVLVPYEEDLFAVMEVAFSTNAAINGYLCWAVRTNKRAVSPITELLEQNEKLYEEVIQGKRMDSSSMYEHFFAAARACKESKDNLGEELLAICLHILSNLPGEDNWKFGIITEDKDAAAKIDVLFKHTAKQHKGKNIFILSTPKLLQILYREGLLVSRESIEAILATGNSGNITVLGTNIHEIRAKEISLPAGELAESIAQANGIQILF